MIVRSTGCTFQEPLADVPPPAAKSTGVMCISGYAVPDRKNPLASNPGQGCVGGLAAIAALVVDGILVIPIAIVVAVTVFVLPLVAATIVSVLTAAVYGFGAWLIGRRVSTNHLQGRMPELLDAVSPRQAA